MRTSDFYDEIVVGARVVGLNFENGKNRRCFLSHRAAGIVLWALGTLCSVTSACAQSNIAIANPDGQSSRTWQIGGFAGGGFAPDYFIHDQGESASFSLDFTNAGIEFGRMVTANHGGGPFHGRGEALIELLPFWMAEYPKQMISIRNNINEFPTKTTFGPYSRRAIA